MGRRTGHGLRSGRHCRRRVADVISDRKSCAGRTRSTARLSRRSTSTSRRRCSPPSARCIPTTTSSARRSAPRPGTSNRRWIFDGIDGTHNYAARSARLGDHDRARGRRRGRGRRRVGARCMGAGGGRRAVAEHGWRRTARTVRSTGAATSSCGAAARPTLDDGDGDGDAVGGVHASGGATRCAQPFRQPESPRSQSIVLDAVRVASAEIDAAVITLGSIWDFAAPSLILARGGRRVPRRMGRRAIRHADRGVHQRRVARSDPRPARCRSVRRSPTWRDWLERSACRSEPMTSRRSTGGDRSASGRWRRCRRATTSTRRPPEVLNIVDERAAHLTHPLVGVTTNGTLLTGLRSLDDAPHVSTHRSPTPRWRSCRRSRPTNASGRCSRWTPRSGGCGSTST